MVHMDVQGDHSSTALWLSVVPCTAACNGFGSNCAAPCSVGGGGHSGGGQHLCIQMAQQPQHPNVQQYIGAVTSVLPWEGEHGENNLPRLLDTDRFCVAGHAPADAYAGFVVRWDWKRSADGQVHDSGCITVAAVPESDGAYRCELEASKFQENAQADCVAFKETSADGSLVLGFRLALPPVRSWRNFEAEFGDSSIRVLAHDIKLPVLALVERNNCLVSSRGAYVVREQVKLAYKSTKWDVLQHALFDLLSMVKERNEYFNVPDAESSASCASDRPGGEVSAMAMVGSKRRRIGQGDFMVPSADGRGERRDEETAPLASPRHTPPPTHDTSPPPLPCPDPPAATDPYPQSPEMIQYNAAAGVKVSVRESLSEAVPPCNLCGVRLSRKYYKGSLLDKTLLKATGAFLLDLCLCPEHHGKLEADSSSVMFIVLHVPGLVKGKNKENTAYVRLHIVDGRLNYSPHKRGTSATKAVDLLPWPIPREELLDWREGVRLWAPPFFSLQQRESDFVQGGIVNVKFFSMGAVVSHDFPFGDIRDVEDDAKQVAIELGVRRPNFPKRQKSSGPRKKATGSNAASTSSDPPLAVADRDHASTSIPYVAPPYSAHAVQFVEDLLAQRGISEYNADTPGIRPLMNLAEERYRLEARQSYILRSVDRLLCEIADSYQQGGGTLPGQEHSAKPRRTLPEFSVGESTRDLVLVLDADTEHATRLMGTLAATASLHAVSSGAGGFESGDGRVVARLVDVGEQNDNRLRLSATELAKVCETIEIFARENARVRVIVVLAFALPELLVAVQWMKRLQSSTNVVAVGPQKEAPPIQDYEQSVCKSICTLVGEVCMQRREERSVTLSNAVTKVGLSDWLVPGSTSPPQDSLVIQPTEDERTTPLHCGAHEWSLHESKEMLHDVELRSALGRTPLMLACARAPVMDAEEHRSCELRRAATVLHLLKMGADVDATDTRGWTALHYAVAGGLAHIVPMLLKYGADAHVETDCGKTCVKLAADNGFFQLSRALVRLPENDDGGSEEESEEEEEGELAEGLGVLDLQLSQCSSGGSRHLVEHEATAEVNSKQVKPLLDMYTSDGNDAPSTSAAPHEEELGKVDESRQDSRPNKAKVCVAPTSSLLTRLVVGTTRAMGSFFAKLFDRPQELHHDEDSRIQMIDNSGSGLVVSRTNDETGKKYARVFDIAYLQSESILDALPLLQSDYSLSNVYKYLEEHNITKDDIEKRRNQVNEYLWAYTTNTFYRELNRRLNNYKKVEFTPQELDYCKILVYYIFAL
eukprot:TRINITY_DN1023_c0_g1_i2.p1 TRINITY_DN1023_c0_g1~~TRINITY_DN1023_c0_g1_i2.p1  ORF type:complete len:1274 (+),score=191.97 TRINITY_DN1023_c0_g1_i2:97-3918(+)